MGEYVGQFIGDYIFQIGVALVALAGATAAWITARRQRYVKSVEFKRGIEAIRVEFRRSMDEARAVANKKTTTVGDKLLAVIKPIDTTVTDLNVRLARLEEHAESVEAFMAGSQNALQDNEQIVVQLRKLEQKLSTLTDQVSMIEQAIDSANLRDQERHDAIEIRLTSTEKRMGDVFPRLDLGEKARADLGGLISLFVKQLKRVDITSVEIAARVAQLEGLRAKIGGLEQRLTSTLNDENRRAENFTTTHHVDIGHIPQNPADDAGLIETNDGSAEGKPTLIEEPRNESGLDLSSLSGNSSEIGANGHG